MPRNAYEAWRNKFIPEATKRANGKYPPDISRSPIHPEGYSDAQGFKWNQCFHMWMTELVESGRRARYKDRRYRTLKATTEKLKMLGVLKDGHSDDDMD